MESQLKWPQGMNPGRTRIPKPFSVVQTSDVNSENGFARSVSTNLILEDIVEASKARLEITNMIQAEWGGQDTGLNTGGMKKSLEKLRQEWEHKFKKLKAVIDTRCRERVGAAKANAQAKEAASKNL